MAVDRKYGRVTTERGAIGENEPVVVFRAQDKLLGPLLDHYMALCVAAGSSQNHLDLIQGNREEVRAWQEENYTRVPVSPTWPAGQ